MSEDQWPLVALAGAQFVMVLDQSVMNVSISQLVIDFNTNVTTIQHDRPRHRVPAPPEWRC